MLFVRSCKALGQYLSSLRTLVSSYAVQTTWVDANSDIRSSSRVMGWPIFSCCGSAPSQVLQVTRTIPSAHRDGQTESSLKSQLQGHQARLSPHIHQAVIRVRNHGNQTNGLSSLTCKVSIRTISSCGASSVLPSGSNNSEVKKTRLFLFDTYLQSFWPDNLLP